MRGRGRIRAMSTPFDFNPFDDATRRNPYPALRARPRAAASTATRACRSPRSSATSDVTEVLRDWRTWSSQFPPPPGFPEFMNRAPSMIGTDPPEHERLRGLVNQAFTPKIIRRLEPRMVEIADAAARHGARRSASVDLVQALTYPLPVTIIAEIIGVPTEDNARFKDWSDKLVETLGVGLFAPPDRETFERNQKLVDELGEYFAAARRAAPARAARGPAHGARRGGARGLEALVRRARCRC